VIFASLLSCSTEDQAVDRVHRLGQTKDVEIVRFICKDSVEEKIIELQDAKRQMTTTALTRASKSREDQQADRLSDLLHLFK
jgi:SWI/SNF-related matrix-associated actin-dependent regulator of chromatin subfamily A3